MLTELELVEAVAEIFEEQSVPERPRLTDEDVNLVLRKRNLLQSRRCGWCAWCEVHVLITDADIDQEGVWCGHCGTGLVAMREESA